MRVIFTIFLSVVLLVFLAACGSTQAVEEANQAATEANTDALSGDVPKFEDARTALAEGNKYFDANQNEKAIQAYEQAIELDPDLAEAHFQLGVSYSLLENEQELIPTAIEPTEGETNKKSDKEEEKPRSVKAFEAAVKSYEKYLKDNPEDDLAYFNLGRAHSKLNDDKEARKALEKAVKLNPENSLYQLELGTILIKLAQYDEAIRALKKAIELDDGNVRAEALLVKAEAGKKRVDFGVEKLKEEAAANGSRSEPDRRSGRSKKEDEDGTEEPDANKRPDKKPPKPEPKKTAGSAANRG